MAHNDKTNDTKRIVINYRLKAIKHAIIIKIPSINLKAFKTLKTYFFKDQQRKIPKDSVIVIKNLLDDVFIYLRYF